MKLRRFSAKDTRTAMRMIRDTLGDDAVIIANTPNQEGVEIVAAIDYDAHVLNIEENTTSLGAVQKEMSLLREMLGDKLSALHDKEQAMLTPVLHHYQKLLSEAGFSLQLIKLLTNEIEPNASLDSAFVAVQNSLANLIQTTAVDIVNQHGIHAFVGPTGVGKTTTIAKIAARYALKYGSQSLALVTTDNYRIAAHEQLKTYANILGVEIDVVDTADELESLKNAYTDKKLILIDTAGTNQHDDKVKQQHAIFTPIEHELNVHLAISSTTQQSIANSVFNAYTQHFHTSSVILTKIDEAVRIAPLIGLCIEKQMPLSYLTHGQRVPEDLQVANAHNITKSLLSTVSERSPAHAQE